MLGGDKKYMPDIKTKQKVQGERVKIKQFDKSKIYANKIKNNVVTIKQRTQEFTRENTSKNDNSPNEYASNKIESKMNIAKSRAINKFNQEGKKAVTETKDNIYNVKNKIQDYKTKKLEKELKNKENQTNSVRENENVGSKIEKVSNKVTSNLNSNSINLSNQEKQKLIKQNQIKNFQKTNEMHRIRQRQNLLEDIRKRQNLSKLKNSIGNTPKIKKVDRTIKQAEIRTYKTANKTAKTTKEMAKKTYQITKAVAKKTAVAVKKAIKVSAMILKKLILGAKALISAIIAGGWVAVLIIVIIAIIGLVCSSVYGIFFSSEKSTNMETMNSVIREINKDFTNKITEIQNSNDYDDFTINSNKAEWKDVLSIYAVVMTNGDDASEVITIDDTKKARLKEIFWDMNEINYEIQEESTDIEIIEDDGSTRIETQIRKILHIEITSKTIEEMKELYNFNANQNEQLAEIRKEEFDKLWANVIYGISNGSNDIVQVALEQVGNIGGEPFWSWYGFNARVEWCACFVSYCANECGYIEMGIIPKFANCETEGVAFFKTCNLWQDRGFTPNAGDIIFFDWVDKVTGLQDGEADHVGIVEKCENGRVYTIEGNSGDCCKQKDYDINSIVILGYGVPQYE